MISVTQTAAKKVKLLLEKENKGPDFGLRVGVRAGGCSGYEYVLDFDTKQPDDFVVETEGVKVFVDPKSLLLLKGSTIDYVESLVQSGFKVENPNAKGSCGCGQSWSY